MAADVAATVSLVRHPFAQQAARWVLPGPTAGRSLTTRPIDACKDAAASGTDIIEQVSPKGDGPIPWNALYPPDDESSSGRYITLHRTDKWPLRELICPFCTLAQGRGEPTSK
jgi:hypothetical protein